MKQWLRDLFLGRPRQLQSLAHWNRVRCEVHKRQRLREPRPNGLACPNCGAELDDVDPFIILDTGPFPERKVRCRACQWWGSRLA